MGAGFNVVTGSTLAHALSQVSFPGACEITALDVEHTAAGSITLAYAYRI